MIDAVVHNSYISRNALGAALANEYMTKYAQVVTGPENDLEHALDQACATNMFHAFVMHLCCPCFPYSSWPSPPSRIGHALCFVTTQSLAGSRPRTCHGP